MQITIGIRIAVDADAPAISRLLGPSLSRHIESVESFTYVAEAEEVFGLVSIGVADRDLFGDETGEVLAWRVEEPHTSNGLGRKLLVHGLTVLKRRGFEQAVLWLPSNLERAGQIAELVGFEPTGYERVSNSSEGSVTSTALIRDLSDLF